MGTGGRNSEREREIGEEVKGRRDVANADNIMSLQNWQYKRGSVKGRKDWTMNQEGQTEGRRDRRTDL